MNDYERIARIIRYLDQHHVEQPDLDTLAKHVGLSRFHFHRLFSHWAGITPKEFLQCLTLAHVRQLLQQGQSVLDAALDAGFSGPGRLHDLCLTLEAATPGEIKSGGAAWTIQAGFAETPFGTCLVGQSPRGICHLSFVSSHNRPPAAAAIHKDWPRAKIQWKAAGLSRFVAPLFTRPHATTARPVLRAVVRGTAFQVRVWRALLEVPKGTLVSYGALAHAIGRPSAARAVGSAVGDNPLAYLIPCHRVIRETGVIGQYHWGPERKRAMIAWEARPLPETPHQPH